MLKIWVKNSFLGYVYDMNSRVLKWIERLDTDTKNRKTALI